jgi:hypothetical protein
MPTLKSLMIFAALLAGGTSLAMAQNGLPTVGVVAGTRELPCPTDICMPTIGLTTATGIGITKQIAAKVTSAHRSRLLTLPRSE